MTAIEETPWSRKARELAEAPPQAPPTPEERDAWNVARDELLEAWEKAADHHSHLMSRFSETLWLAKCVDEPETVALARARRAEIEPLLPEAHENALHHWAAYMHFMNARYREDR